MNIPALLENPAAALADALGPRCRDLRQRNARRIDIRFAPGDVVEVARAMFAGLGARFAIATGIDTSAGVEILYHYAFDRQALMVTAHTRVPRDAPEIESITGVIRGAEWIEREIAELLGVRFLHHPRPEHLLLADDWPEGNYPLRRQP